MTPVESTGLQTPEMGDRRFRLLPERISTDTSNRVRQLRSLPAAGRLRAATSGPQHVPLWKQLVTFTERLALDCFGAFSARESEALQT
jgi:hypothetical protein